MSVASSRIGKKEFVVLPRRRYEQLARAERDQEDAEIARKAREDHLAGKLKTISLSEARRKRGV